MEEEIKEIITETKFSTKKKVFSLVALVFLVLTLAGGVFLTKQKQDVRKKATANQVTASLVTPTTNVNPGGTFTVDVFLKPPAAVEPLLEVTAAAIWVSYPDNLVTLQTVSPGEFFKDANFVSGQTEMMALGLTCTQATDCTTYTQASKITCLNGFCQNSDYPLNNGAGQAKIYLGASCHISQPTDGGSWCHPQTLAKRLATLTFQAKSQASGQATIGLGQASEVAAKFQTGNVLVTNSLPSSIINISGPTATPTPTVTATPTTTISPTASPTPIPTPEPGKAHLTSKVKFQGINQQRQAKTVRVILKQGDQEKYRFESIDVSSDQNGIYSGTVTNIEPGAYDLFIKGWTHLQKKFAGVVFNQGENTQDWSGQELLTGDATKDDKINIQDFRILVEDYLKSESPADFNLDGKVNIQDFRFLAENYLKEGEK
ncbi:MAG: hypothetical protein M1575_04325 [Patescibacteria group bacterium]|nr:hypothetical protein [Patescibacteria group bacterium]